MATVIKFICAVSSLFERTLHYWIQWDVPCTNILHKALLAGTFSHRLRPCNFPVLLWGFLPKPCFLDSFLLCKMYYEIVYLRAHASVFHVLSQDAHGNSPRIKDWAM